MSDVILPPTLDRRARYREGVNEQLADRRAAQGIEPSISHPMRPAPGSPTVSGWWQMSLTNPGIWVNTWQSYLPVLVHSAIRAKVPLSTDATGAGVARLQMVYGLGTTVYSDQFTLNPNTYDYYDFNWVHMQPLWTTQDVFLTLQANISSISVAIFMPLGNAIVQREPRDAVVGGLAF